MIKLNIKGDVVDSETGAFYDFFDMPNANPAAVARALAADPNDEVTVSIASDGGDVFAASEIYTMLKDHAGTVNVVVEGLAASAASVIAMAGDKVSMSPTAMMMIHKASLQTYGNADDLNHDADVLDKADQAIASTYEAKTGMDEGQVLDLMSKETWLTAKDAVDKGFADEVMVFDEAQAVVTNSAGSMIPKASLNKLATLMIKAGDAPDNLAPKPQLNNETKPTLRDAKLAILMGKTQKEG